MAILNREFFSFDEFELHPSARALLRKGEKVALAPKSFLRCWSAWSRMRAAW
jgi:DNA-binding winged helix-turn-helix (wHTH) protein